MSKRRQHTVEKLSRPAYLQTLLLEYNKTKDLDAKRQILAHFSNFAYDPSNYCWLRQLNILDLFLDVLADQSTQSEDADAVLYEFAFGGLCNLLLDPKSQSIFIQSPDAIALLEEGLIAEQVNIQCAALTIYIQLAEHIEYRSNLFTSSMKDRVHSLLQHKDKCVANLATILKQDYLDQ
jgi:hypothetical protein